MSILILFLLSVTVSVVWIQERALATMGFKGGTRGATEWNPWMENEKQDRAKEVEQSIDKKQKEITCVSMRIQAIKVENNQLIKESSDL